MSALLRGRNFLRSQSFGLAFAAYEHVEDGRLKIVDSLEQARYTRVHTYVTIDLTIRREVRSAQESVTTVVAAAHCAPLFVAY